MPAAALPAIIGGVSSIAGSLIGGNATKNAAGQVIDAQGKVITQANQAVNSGQGAIQGATGQGQAGVTQAAGEGQAGASFQTGQANLALQQAISDGLARLQPYSEAGAGALPQLQDLAGANGELSKQFGFNPSDLQNDPGYQFTLQQGQKALQQAAAARGGLFSAGTQKSLAQYTTGLSNQYFNDAYNRAANTFGINRQGALSRVSTLQGLAGQGQAAAGQGASLIGSSASQQSGNLQSLGQFNANLGANAAGQAAQLGQQGANSYANLGIQGAQLVGNALTNQGNAGAAGKIGVANAYAGGLGGLANSVGALLSNRASANSFGSPSGFLSNYYASNPGGGG